MGTAEPTECLDVPMEGGAGSSEHEYDDATRAPMAFDNDLDTWCAHRRRRPPPAGREPISPLPF
jgi:hypothetical protein